MSAHKKVSDEEILEAVKQAEDEVISAPALAEELGITRQGMDKRLKQLEKAGEVRQVKINATTAVWELR